MPIFICRDCARGPCTLDVSNGNDKEEPEGCPFVPDYHGYAVWRFRYQSKNYMSEKND